ncbi:MAG: MBL fold metallo-hydrolase [Armatimonadota bacterium]
MKVFFLGTGSAEGFPALFSDTEINREALRRGGPNLRSRSTIVVDGLVKVDLPPDSLAHVHRFPEVSLASLQHLLFTHSHDDHFAIRELQYLSPNFAPDRRYPLNVYAGNELIRRMIPEMSSFFEAAPVRFHSIAPFEELTIGHLVIVPVLARHKPDETCLNFVFRDGSSSCLYATDTGWYHDASWRYLEGAALDVVVLECGKGIGDSPYEGHLSFDDCVRFRAELLRLGALSPTGRVLLTHICPSGLLLHEELSERAAEHGMEVAWDGLEIAF